MVTPAVPISPAATRLRPVLARAVGTLRGWGTCGGGDVAAGMLTAAGWGTRGTRSPDQAIGDWRPGGGLAAGDTGLLLPGVSGPPKTEVKVAVKKSGGGCDARGT